VISMKKNILKVLNAPWYFVPFAAYPVLALLSYNISQVRLYRRDPFIDNLGRSGGAVVPALSPGL